MQHIEEKEKKIKVYEYVPIGVYKVGGRYMKHNLLNDNDGTGQVLRQCQTDALTWTGKRLNTDKQLVIQAPVGSGKGKILRSLQAFKPGPLVTANNTLTRQYENIYPNLNLFIGKIHYNCDSFKQSCAEKQASLKKTKHKCENCPLDISRNRYKNGDHSIVNPLSLYYANKNPDNPRHDICYVDEAHSCVSLIRLLTTDKIKLTSDDMKLNLTNELFLVPWLQLQTERLTKTLNGKSPEQRLKIEAKIDKYLLITENLISSPEIFSLFTEEKGTILNIMPLSIPPRLIDDIFGKKAVFTSATMMPSDIKELMAGKQYEFLDLDSPIPLANRRINLIAPKETQLGFGKCDPEKLVAHLENVMEDHGKGQRIFVHATYKLSEQMAPFWKRNDIITHTKETKADELKKFLNEGGVMVGSGLSEGLDLKDDLCGLNIVTQLNYPNLSDNFVSKRKALEDGAQWYREQTLVHLMQAVGRGVRHENDKCTTIVVDNRAPKFLLECNRSKLLPKYVFDSLVFGR